MKTEPTTGTYIGIVNQIDPNLEEAGHRQIIGSFSKWWDSWATHEQSQDSYKRSFHEMTWEAAIKYCLEEVEKKTINEVEGQWDKGYNMAILDVSHSLKRLLER